MAVKGTLAKEYVVKKLQEAFGEDFVGEYDKKIYVWGKEGAEKIQVAISMTCPKTPIGAVPKKTSNVIDLEHMGEEVVEEPKSSEITDEEKENIARLLRELNL